MGAGDTGRRPSKAALYEEGGGEKSNSVCYTSKAITRLSLRRDLPRGKEAGLHAVLGVVVLPDTDTAVPRGGQNEAAVLTGVDHLQTGDTATAANRKPNREIKFGL